MLSKPERDTGVEEEALAIPEWATLHIQDTGFFSLPGCSGRQLGYRDAHTQHRASVYMAANQRTREHRSVRFPLDSRMLEYQNFASVSDGNQF